MIKCEHLTFLTSLFFRQLGLDVDHIGLQISKIMKIFLLKCSHKIPRMKIQKNSILINHDDNSSKDIIHNNLKSQKTSKVKVHETTWNPIWMGKINSFSKQLLKFSNYTLKTSNSTKLQWFSTGIYHLLEFWNTTKLALFQLYSIFNCLWLFILGQFGAIWSTSAISVHLNWRRFSRKIITG